MFLSLTLGRHSVRSVCVPATLEPSFLDDHILPLQDEEGGEGGQGGEQVPLESLIEVRGGLCMDQVFLRSVYTVLCALYVLLCKIFS